MPEAIDSPPPQGGADPGDPLLGRQVRDFRILERIGRGGMGAVYKAEHALLRETRALKVIRAERFHAVPDAIERFQREARIAVRLRHPNLVLIFDFFIEGGDHFLVMEYVVGESLAQRIRATGALSAEETCRIGIQCCAGLAHAHDMGIVHRDLSPENILLQPGPQGPQAKIIDFGIARAAVSGSGPAHADAESTLTRAGDFLGKPRYSSPEQAGKLRAGETLDQRSDLYTLGLILYEMVTGDLPFHSDTEIGYLSLHAFQAPARPGERRPDLVIPAAVEHVILRCLEKDRSRRFQDARALGEALEWAWRSGDLRDAPFGPAAATGGAEVTRYVPTAQPAFEGAPTPRIPRRVASVPADDEEGGGPLQLAALALVLTLLGVGLGTAAWWWTKPSDPGAISLPAFGTEPEAPAKLPAAEAAPQAPTADAEAKLRAAASEAQPPTAVPEAKTPAAEVAELAPTAGAVETPRPPEPPRTTPAPEAAPAAPVAVPIPEASAPHAAPAPAPEKVRPPARAPAAQPARETAAAPRTAAPVAPALPPFADPAEMDRAFQDALEFEAAHDKLAAIANWDRFLQRQPSQSLEQKARKRRTQLRLDSL